SSAIAYNANAAAIQAALWTISALNGKVTVVADPDTPLSTSTFLVKFTGFGATDQPLLRVDARGLPFGSAGTPLNQFRITGFGMPGAGTDTINVANDQLLSDLMGLLTISGDQPRADVVTLAKGSPQQGSSIAPVNEIQQLTVDATAGTFTLTYVPAIVTTVTQ